MAIITVQIPQTPGDFVPKEVLLAVGVIGYIAFFKPQQAL